MSEHNLHWFDHWDICEYSAPSDASEQYHSLTWSKAGEVPRIQYQIADTDHVVILGNVMYVVCRVRWNSTDASRLFGAVGISTLIFWPLPLLHGRKPYTLAAFALMLPLQFPQAIAIAGYRDTDSVLARVGLLLPRALTGLAMGFANMNQLPTLLDLFGASLQSENPHQETVVPDDMRRQGGGIGLWLGVWTWCYIGSLSVGFCVGACIISKLDPSWGFYLVIILLAFFLFVNVIAPETRPSPYRRSLIHFFDSDDKIKRRVARGEVKLHISNEGPKWWWEEVWAGVVLTKRMVFQSGYFLMMLYLAWIYALVVLVIVVRNDPPAYAREPCADLLTDSRSPSFSRLPVEVAVRGSRISLPRSRRTLGRTPDARLPVLPRPLEDEKIGQCDCPPYALRLDLAYGPSLHLHTHLAIGRRRVYSDKRRSGNELGGTCGLRGFRGLPLELGNHGMCRHHHGDL